MPKFLKTNFWHLTMLHLRHIFPVIDCTPFLFRLCHIRMYGLLIATMFRLHEQEDPWEIICKNTWNICFLFSIVGTLLGLISICWCHLNKRNRIPHQCFQYLNHMKSVTKTSASSWTLLNHIYVDRNDVPPLVNYVEIHLWSLYRK